MRLDISVNGRAVRLDVEPHATLLDVLRERLLLTGTKRGCDEGECGACTVLIDGQAADACIVAAMSVNGCAIETVEGLALPGGTLSRLPQQLIRTGAVHGGFCRAGIRMPQTPALRETPTLSDDEALDAIAGNICRCTGYAQILEAVRGAVEDMADELPDWGGGRAHRRGVQGPRRGRV